MEKRYEVTISFTYDAESPEDAVRQFMGNIPNADWYVHAKELESKKEFIVDTEDYSVEARPQ